MKHITKLFYGTAIGCAAALALVAPASAATVGAPVSGKAGDTVSLRPAYTGDVQGITQFTVPAGMRIQRIMSSSGSDQTASCGAFNAAHTAIRCGATNSHQNAASYLYAVVTITDQAQFGAQTGNIRVQRASNDTGRITADTNFVITVVATPPKITGVTYDEAAATITGTGVAGNTIDIRDREGHVIASGTVGSDGSFSVVLPAATTGLVVVDQHDSRGNGSTGVGVTIAPPLDTPIVDPAVAGGVGLGVVGLGSLILRRRIVRR